jgi:hypothetical protein
MQRPLSHAPRSDAAQRIVGLEIERIDRIFYEFMGVIEADEGALEVHFTDGSVARFDGGATGESLGVDDHAWVDPFAGELSPENEAFVAQCGKWTRVPVSTEAPYRELIGATVNAVTILHDRFGRESALALETDARTLWFVAGGDECRVCWAHPLPYKNRRRYAAAVGC